MKNLEWLFRENGQCLNPLSHVCKKPYAWGPQVPSTARWLGCLFEMLRVFNVRQTMYSPLMSLGRFPPWVFSLDHIGKGWISHWEGVCLVRKIEARKKSNVSGQLSRIALSKTAKQKGHLITGRICFFKDTLLFIPSSYSLLALLNDGNMFQTNGNNVEGRFRKPPLVLKWGPNEVNSFDCPKLVKVSNLSPKLNDLIVRFPSILYTSLTGHSSNAKNENQLFFPQVHPPHKFVTLTPNFI